MMKLEVLTVPQRAAMALRALTKEPTTTPSGVLELGRITKRIPVLQTDNPFIHGVSQAPEQIRAVGIV